MNDFISSVETELKNAGNTPTGNHLKTGDIRKLSARLFKEMKCKSIEYVFSVCNELLKRKIQREGAFVH